MRDIAFGLARFKNRYPRTPAGPALSEHDAAATSALLVGLTDEVRSAMMAAPVVLRNPPMNVPPLPSFGSPAGSSSPTGATVTTAPAYRIANARVPVDLAPALADHAAPDRFAACEIVVDGARISLLAPPGAAPATADLPTIDLRGGI